MIFGSSSIAEELDTSIDTTNAAASVIFRSSSIAEELDNSIDATYVAASVIFCSSSIAEELENSIDTTIRDFLAITWIKDGNGATCSRVLVHFRFLAVAFFPRDFVASQVRGVGVGFEEPHLRVVF